MTKLNFIDEGLRSTGGAGLLYCGKVSRRPADQLR